MVRTLTNYLEAYYEKQDTILVCYRPTLKAGWSDRCVYLSKEYDPDKRYNHRSMLTEEVVFEYDDEDKAKNREYARVIAKRLAEDGIDYALWDSGNKSYHLHCFVHLGGCKHPSLFKNAFVRYYTKGLPVPDMRLTSDGHLIRAEYGVHEKSGKYKRLIEQSPNYPRTATANQEVWNNYFKEMKAVVQRSLTRQVNSLVEHPGFKWVLTSEQFRNANDGRERALFMLIHVLKPQYVDRKNELIKYLIEWYRYSSGDKLTDYQIAAKVNYHWNKSYTFGEKYLNELLESVGRADLIIKGDTNANK